MTSKLTRERLEEIRDCSWMDDLGLSMYELSELASMALAALDSEPVAEVLSIRPGNDTSTIDRALPVGTPLYRHAQPAPASESVVVTDDMAYAFHHALTDGPLGDDDVEDIKTGLRAAFASVNASQPAPVVSEDLYKLANHIASSKNGLPDEWQDWAEELETDIRRAAMLQAGNSPAHSGLRPEQSSIAPAQDGNSQAHSDDRPVAWHHTAKAKEGNYGTCCFSYSPSHDFGPKYEKSEAKPHYLPEKLDYDRALRFLSDTPRSCPQEVKGE